MYNTFFNKYVLNFLSILKGLRTLVLNCSHSHALPTTYFCRKNFRKRRNIFLSEYLVVMYINIVENFGDRDAFDVHVH